MIKKIETVEQYNQLKTVAHRLVEQDPDPKSFAGKHLLAVATLIEEYEKSYIGDFSKEVDYQDYIVPFE